MSEAPPAHPKPLLLQARPYRWLPLIGLVALAVALTAPLSLHPSGLARLDGDGRFSLWNIGWVAHALTTDPLNVWNANIFFPSRTTLAYSEANLLAGAFAAPIYAAAHVPQLAISTKPEYTKLGLPTTLRLVASDDLQSRALGSYAAQLQGVQHFAVVDDNTPYGKGLADSAAEVLAGLGRKVEVRRSLDDHTSEFSTLVAEFVAAKTDVVVTTLSDFQVEALIQQLAKVGLSNMTIVGGDTIKTARLPHAADLPVRAIYATSSIVEPKEFPELPFGPGASGGVNWGGPAADPRSREVRTVSGAPFVIMKVPAGP